MSCDSLEDHGHPFRIVETAKLGNSRYLMTGFGKQSLGLVNAHLAKHFPRRAVIVFLELQLHRPSGNVQIVAENSNRYWVSNTLVKISHRSGEKFVVDREVIGGVPQDHPLSGKRRWETSPQFDRL